ncbi:Scr1 family TA system antitoxin-like transcriptional regulator [Streptomyces sp. NPDC090442]|uniref:Scr1 family TA system antitoxin-like transcriptional regulator n=1 Tax=Streptomyces sp. NPDC090442 TaxID=3365962 RepID=UPI0037F13D4D
MPAGQPPNPPTTCARLLMKSGEGARVIYTEGIRAAALIDEPSAVRHLSRAYDLLAASALPREASARLIRELMEEL